MFTRELEEPLEAPVSSSKNKKDRSEEMTGDWTQHSRISRVYMHDQYLHVCIYLSTIFLYLFWFTWICITLYIYILHSMHNIAVQPANPFVGDWIGRFFAKLVDR